MQNDIFRDRALGAYPVSIGIGLMLESIFTKNNDNVYDPSRAMPQKISIDKYKNHYYSMYTIVRGIVSSIKNVKDYNVVLSNQYFIRTLLDELYVLNSLYENTTCNFVIHFPDYSKVYANLNKNKDSDVLKTMVMYGSIRKALRNTIANKDMPIIYDDIKLPASSDKTLITTSTAVDLLNMSKISKLELVESHTGKLKTKLDFNTKYHKLGDTPLTHIPFMEELLYILGDNTISKQMSIKTRQTLVNLSIESKWTAATSRDKVLYDIRKVPILLDVLIPYTKSYF